MIRVRRDTGSLRISGHAGTAPAGQDLVCAAVSILAETLADCLPAGAAVLGEGLAEFSFPEPDPQVDFVVRGMELLAKCCPEAVKMEEFSSI